MAREANDTDVEGEVFSSELCSDSNLAGAFEKLGFEFGISEGATVFVAAGGELVVVARRGHLDSFQTGLGGGAANDKGEVIRGARCGAEALHFLDTEFTERLRIEQGLCLLVEEGFVG